MSVHPIAPALWICAMLTLVLQLVLYFIGSSLMDPIISLVVYFLFMEGSKFVGEMTVREDDGSDNDT